MVYNSVKYVQIGKKNGHVMVFLLVPISSLWKYPQPRSFMTLLIFGDCLDRVKGICWDCKWFSISSTATGRTETSNKSGAMNRNPDVLVRVAPKAEGLQGRRLDFSLVVDSRVADWAAQSSRGCMRTQ